MGVMDNVNVLRIGFYAPDFSLADSNGDLFILKENLKDTFVCLCFFPDTDNDKIVGYLKDLNAGLPSTASGLPLKIVTVSPVKPKRLKELKDKSKFNFAMLSDAQMDVSQKYHVDNSGGPKPSVYFSVFIIDDGGIIRYRMSEVAGLSKYLPEELKSEIGRLI